MAEVKKSKTTWAFSWGLQSVHPSITVHLFSTFWQVVTFCVNHYPLHKEIFLIRFENYAKLQVQKDEYRGQIDVFLFSRIMVVLTLGLWPPWPRFWVQVYSIRHVFCPKEQTINSIRKWLIIPDNFHANVVLMGVSCHSSHYCSSQSSLSKTGDDFFPIATYISRSSTMTASEQEEATWSAPNLFLHILWPEYVVFSAIGP